MAHVVSAEPTAVITGTREATEAVPAGAVAFVVSDPPTSADMDRWAGLLAASPALADATWSAKPGSDVRR